MRASKKAQLALTLSGLTVVILLLSACAAGRTGKTSSIWQRSGSCPATRVDNHVY